MSPESPGLSRISPFQFSGSHSFPANAFKCQQETLGGWESTLHFKSATHRTRLWVCFSATSAHNYRIHWSLSGTRGSFQAIYEIVELRIWVPGSTFSFLLILVHLEANSQFPYSHRFDKNIWRYHVHSHPKACFRKYWLSCIQWWWFAYLRCCITPQTLSVLSTAWSGVFSAFKSNQISEPIPRTPEPILKTHP